MLITAARKRGIVKGVKISDSEYSHLLFVDDIITFGQESLRELKGITHIYCKTTGMEITMRNSTMLFNALAEDEKS